MLDIHIKILRFLLDNGLTPVKELNFPQKEIAYLTSLGYIKYHPIEYNDRIARYGITAKGKEALILFQENVRKESKQIAAAKKNNRKDLIFKIAGAAIMYLFGLFTPEIKAFILSLF